jgi:predicted thioesterase
LACALDEVLGVAALVSGATGMTVALSVSLKAGTPFGVPVDIVARYTGSEGRKSFTSGEVLVDGKVTVEATAIFVGERRD